MTIDEAIARERELAERLREQYECMMECSEIFREQKKVFIEQCKYDAEYHEQLAEWLEELKAIKDGGKAIRNEAIDDFIHECDKYCGFYSGKNKSITREDILNIAEQLKAKNNERRSDGE